MGVLPVALKNLFGTVEMPFDGSEFSEILLKENITIERIVSSGQKSADGFWYDQPLDEWVALLQGNASILFKEGHEVHLVPGDQLLIPAHTFHRVTFTSVNPGCIWIAIHGKLLNHNEKLK